MEQMNKPISFNFSTRETEEIALRLEGKVEDKIGKSLRNNQGDSCRTKIDLGNVSKEVRNYVLSRFNVGSFRSKYIGDSMISVYYCIHQ